MMEGSGGGHFHRALVKEMGVTEEVEVDDIEHHGWCQTLFLLRIGEDVVEGRQEVV